MNQSMLQRIARIEPRDAVKLGSTMALAGVVVRCIDGPWEAGAVAILSESLVQGTIVWLLGVPLLLAMTGLARLLMADAPDARRSR